MSSRTPIVSLIAIAIAAATVSSSQAAITGPYTADANTLMLYHLDEASGAFDNLGTTGSSFDLDDNGGATGRDAIGSGGLGDTAFSGFGSSFNALDSGDGTYHGSTVTDGGGAFGTGVPAGPTQANYQGADGAFTWEAMVRTSTLSGQQIIIARDTSTGTRGPNFFINGDLNFGDPAGPDGTLDVAIPNTGDHAFVADEWFHVAVAYDGNEGVAGNLSFYWTRVAEQFGEANLIGTETITADVGTGSEGSHYVGGYSRGAFRLELKGSIDEVRISDVARQSNEFIFVPTPAALPAGLALIGLLATRRQRR